MHVFSVLFLLAHGASGVERVSVFVIEGDSVTLISGVETNKQEDIKWYFQNIRIAQITGDLSFICTDVQCNEGTERFRDRLKLDHQTGSLTIMNTRNTDEGDYELKISSIQSSCEKIFSVSVHGVPGEETREMKRKSVKEGESVILVPGVTKNPNDVIMWYFNKTLIAEITGEPSKICTNVQTEERFSDRLRLGHQTGSLTIMNTINADAGEYELDISSSSFNIKRRFSVSVTGPSSASVREIRVALFVVPAVLLLASVIYIRIRQNQKDARLENNDQVNQNEVVKEDADETSSNQTDALVMNNSNSLSPKQIEIEPEAASETSK